MHPVSQRKSAALLWQAYPFSDDGAIQGPARGQYVRELVLLSARMSAVMIGMEEEAVVMVQTICTSQRKRQWGRYRLLC